MLKIIFVRHGFSLANAEKRYAGIYDAPLTDVGRAQANAAAEYLKQFPIEAVYSSDITRAMDTARPIANAFGLEIIPSPLRRELNGGDWEGITMEERAEKYPELVYNWQNNISICRCPGGESIEELCLRAQKGLDEIIARHKSGCVAVVSHGIFIRAILGLWHAGCPKGVQELPWMENASVSIVEIDGREKRMTLFNSTAHLAEA